MIAILKILTLEQVMLLFLVATQVLGENMSLGVFGIGFVSWCTPTWFFEIFLAEGAAGELHSTIVKSGSHLTTTDSGLSRRAFGEKALSGLTCSCAPGYKLIGLCWSQ